ncbi:MAG TPA: hypothetical protein VLK33_13265 [Terriglobales bacterium]|nr:hypothetical protein [Terriglobales bacterium]
MIHLKSNTLGQAVKRNFQRASLLGLLLAISSLSAFSQAAGPVWSGTVQCQLNDQDQSYTRQDIQTWTLPGTGPISPTGIPVYNAIWKASGHGQLQRVQGGQTTNIQWTTNVPDTPATITIFVRAADNKLIVKPYHSQLSVFNATNGTRQVIVNGVAQPPTNFSHPASEWQFPRIEVTPPAANGTTTGTSPSLTDVGGVELAHHLGGLPPSASCQWQLTQGTGTPQNSNQGGMGVGSSNQNPPQSGSATTQNGNADCSKSTADIEQSFDAMKADIKTQYDKLIQSTTDPMEIARLTNQEQSTLRNLENQKQHDIQSTNNSCGRTSSGSTTSSSATGSTNGSTTGTTTGTPANGSTTGSLGTTPTTVTPDGYEPNDSQAMARLLGHTPRWTINFY